MHDNPMIAGASYDEFVKDMEVLNGASEIEVVIDSPGGSLFAGRAIYTALKESAARIHVKLLSHASSAASLIACAGDTVSALSCTMSLIHRCSFKFFDPMNIHQLQAQMAEMEAFDRNAAEIYAKKSKSKSAEDFLALMDEGRYFTAQELLDLGLVDEISDEDGKEESEQIEAQFKKRNELIMNEKENKETFETEQAKNAELLATLQALKDELAALSESNKELAAKNEDLEKRMKDQLDEMARIREIDENAALFSDPKAVLEAKYGEKKTTMSQLAVQELQMMAKERQAYLSARAAELNTSGVNDVTADGNIEPALPEQKISERDQAKALLKEEMKKLNK